MRFHRVSACVFVAAASLAGCVGSGGPGDVEYAGGVHVSSPELIPIGEGVDVVADADQPLFYSRGAYWLFHDGFWFRSDSYRGGFVRVDEAYLPTPVRSIDNPKSYAQYRRHAGRNLEARAMPEPRQLGQTPQLPRPTPPVTSPNDVHGTPMLPHHGGVGEENAPPSPQPPASAPPTADRIPPQSDRDHRPPPRETMIRPDDKGTPITERETAKPPQDQVDRGPAPRVDERSRKTDEKQLEQRETRPRDL